MKLGREEELVGEGGRETGLSAEAVPAPGKLPVHLEGRAAADPEQNVGFLIRDRRAATTLAYFPAVGRVTDGVRDAMAASDCVFLDGTFWSSDELPALKLVDKRAEDMAHLPVSGEGGSLALLAGLSTPPANPDPPQQHQSAAPRGFDGASRGRGRGVGRGPRRNGDRAMTPSPRPPLSREELVDWLRREGESRYHDHHRYHVMMHEGTLTQLQLQQWVLNRYYYQTRIPIKDAIIVSKSEDPVFRRMWIHRIHDHDGDGTDEGGLALWLRLAEGVGLDRDEVASCRSVLPGVRFACDGYVELVRERSLLEAVASSLTEFFAPDLMSKRILAWEKHYPWVKPDLLAYFRSRVPRARRDSEEAIDYVSRHATTYALQERCVAALIRKTEILWHLLDCDVRRVRGPGLGAGRRAA